MTRRQPKNDIPRASLWRQEVMSRAEQLESLAKLSAVSGPVSAFSETILTVVHEHLEDARSAARYRSLPAAITGAPIQRAVHNLDMAEVNLYRIVPNEYLEGVLPVLIDEAADVLQSRDRRLQRLSDLGNASPDTTADVSHREAVVAAIYSVKEAGLTAQARVRGFRNVILVAIGIIVAIDFLVLLLGTMYPSMLTVCQEPSGESRQYMCPTGYTAGPTSFDNAIMMFVGVLGATIAAVFALRKVRGTRDPYSLVVALAVLKLPTGALTAFLVPLLVHGGFIPGFGQFDSPQQLLGWAVLFGYSQELFTAVVDRQAAAVLSAAPGASGSSLREGATQSAPAP